MKNTIRHHDFLMEHLKDSKEAAAYLNACAKEGDIFFFIKALKDVIEANGGVGALSKATKLGRTSLYKAFSKSGNPEVKTLEKVLSVYNMKIGVLSN